MCVNTCMLVYRRIKQVLDSEAKRKRKGGEKNMTWGKTANKRARNFKRTMFPSWTSSSTCEIAFWTAESCSTVFISGGAITLSSLASIPWLQHLVSSIKIAIKRVRSANTWPIHPLQKHIRWEKLVCQHDIWVSNMSPEWKRLVNFNVVSTNVQYNQMLLYKTLSYRPDNQMFYIALVEISNIHFM